MGLSARLKKFGQKLTHGYVRQGRWAWWMLIVMPVLVVLWNVGQAVWGGPGGGVILGIHSETDRPILGFSANGAVNMNVFVNSGSSITCYDGASGDMAEIIWTLNTTRTQYNTGMRLEEHDETLPLPERGWGENYLHVHFMPGDRVLLGRSKDSSSLYEDLHNGGNKTRARQDVKDKLYGTGKMN